MTSSLNIVRLAFIVDYAYTIEVRYIKF